MKKEIKVFLLFLLLVTASVLALLFGKYQIPLHTLAGAFLGDMDSPAQTIIFDVRLPRIIAALFVGAALGLSGAAFQAVFVNPLVSPGILGVLSGASFGAALAMVLGLSLYFVQFFSFIGGFIAVGIAFSVYLVYKEQRSILLLILGGIISGSLFTALLSLVKYTADPYDSLPAIVYWLMGSLSTVDGEVLFIVLPFLTAALLLLLSLGKQMNLLSMGDEEAKAMGVNASYMRIIIIIAATVLGTLSVVIAGIVGWVGLVIPHVARLMMGSDHRYVLLTSTLTGALFLLLCDTLCRMLFEVEVPLGIVSALLGIPLFVFMLKNAKQGFET